MRISIEDNVTGEVNELDVNDGKVTIDGSVTVTFRDVRRDEVASIDRVGNDLVLVLDDGQQIVLEDFFAGGTLRDPSEILFADVLAGTEALDVAMAIAATGLALGAASSGGGSSNARFVSGVDTPSPKDEGDTTAPDVPVVDFVSFYELIGTAEPGSTVTVWDLDGNEVASITADPITGEFIFDPNPLGSGKEGRLTATDDAGNVSAAATVNAVSGPALDEGDTTPPTAPVVTTSNGDKLSGTAEPGGVVTLTGDDGVVIGSTTADPTTGIFTFEPNPLGDGEGGTLVVTDPAGNKGPTTVVAPTDATDPTAPVVTTSNGDKLSGTAEPGGVVTLTGDDGVVIGSTTADPTTGIFTFEPNPLGDGEGGTLVVTDPAGNKGPTTVVAPTDATAPDAPTIEILNLDELSGYAENGSVVTLRDADGTVVASTTANSENGEFIFEPNPLGSGKRGSLTATDGAGNESAQETVDAVRGPALDEGDTTAPDVPVVDFVSFYELIGTAEPGSTVTVWDLDGNEVASITADPITGEFIFDPNPLGSGKEGRLTATDDAGNVSAAATVNAVSGPALDEGDTTPPTAPVVTTSNGDKLSGTAEPGGVVTLTGDDGVVIGSTTADPTTGIFTFEPNPLGDGEGGTLLVTDPAGNKGPTTVVAPTDATDPTAPVVTTSNGDKLSGTAEPGGVVTLTGDDGVVIGSTTADPTTGIFTFEPNPLGDGEGGTLLVTDPAGNKGPTTVVAPTDATDPTAPVVTTSNGDKLSGTAEPGGVVTLTGDDGVVIGSTTADPTTGIFTFEPNPLGDGEGGTLLVTDPAGNKGPTTVVAPTDATDPTAPVVTTSNGDKLSGTAEPGGVVTLTGDDGVVIGSTTADPTTGIFTFEPNPLGDGEGGTLLVTDPAGNKGPTTVVAPTDATDPTAPVVTTSNGDKLSGTAEPGGVVTLTGDDGVVIGSTTADPTTGIFTFEPNPLGDGEGGTLLVTDPAGNKGPTTVVAPTDATASGQRQRGQVDGHG
jgi:large repetitive protein